MYTDAAGQRREVGAATQRALLAAMGIHADHAASVEQALREREASSWRQPLPPVLVAWQDRATLRVGVTLPAGLSTAELHWSLRREGGSETAGRLRCSDLPVVERRGLDGSEYLRYWLTLATELTPGYHRLDLRGPGLEATMPLIMAPTRCYVPDALTRDRRLWGMQVRLDTVHSHRSWGAGDLGDALSLLDMGAAQGAGILGLGALHARMPAAGAASHPRAPSSRLYGDVLFLQLEAVPELVDCAEAQRLIGSAEFQARLAAARESDGTDPGRVVALKLEAAGLLFAGFRARHLAPLTDRGRAFRSFQAAGGTALHRHALFTALAAHLRDHDPAGRGWPAWPAPFRVPDSDAVGAFAREHGAEIELHTWIQWLLESQLAAAGDHSAALGLGVGLCLDLALGADPGGAETWSGGSLYARGARLGLPPGFAAGARLEPGPSPMIPGRLAADGYAALAALLGRNMRYAGALNIGDVGNLARQFWIPADAPRAEGAWVRYPLRDLLGVLALESQRNGCLVLGERRPGAGADLRQAVDALGIVSCRSLCGPDDASPDLASAGEHPRHTLVAVALGRDATLAGFWPGYDLAWRHSLGLFADEGQRESLVIGRAEARARVLLALERVNLLPEGNLADPARVTEMSDALAAAIHHYLARTPAMLMTFRPEDVFGVVAPRAVVPGPVAPEDARVPLPVESWARDARFAALCDVLRSERGIGLCHAVAAEEAPGLVIPRATYRLQLNRDFGFRQAAALVPYLRELGISHIYASPYMKARPGSSHGYDIIDHNALNPEIGSEEDFRAFCTQLKTHAMGQLLDLVPNHMGIMGADNRWWLDVLENGHASPYAAYFDIDWQPVKEELRDKVLVPVLGNHYGAILESGELTLQFDPKQGELAVHYHEHHFPLDPATYPDVMMLQRDALEQRLGPDRFELLELESVSHAFESMPPHWETDPQRLEQRQREKEVAKRRLARLCQRCPAIAEHIVANAAQVTGVPGEPASLQRLHQLLQRQAYRLAYWQVAADEINYRRFFDINDLAALRMEVQEVREVTHRRVLDWARHGQIDGFRIDHADGLYDPEDYFRWLQQHFAPSPGAGPAETAPALGRYVVAEKILAVHEPLPAGWDLHGTTGYEFARALTGVLVYAESEKFMTRTYHTFVGGVVDPEELLYQCKRVVIRSQLSSELAMLANLLDGIAQADWRTRDYTLNSLRDALAAVVASFPVYRTYVAPGRVSAEDRRYIDWAVSWAARHETWDDPEVLGFIRSLLLLERAPDADSEYGRQCADFAMKFQQYTGPVMAKALEDTFLYRYNRFVALNEVGNDPRRFGLSIGAFHRQNSERARRWPHAMIASSTHDMKRSEDVRARLAVLSEIPESWAERVASWRRFNRARRHGRGAGRIPSREDEYLLYQTLVGVWPVTEPGPDELEVLRGRVSAYMVKAAREAKLRSSWRRPDSDYESGLNSFVTQLLDEQGGNKFLADFREFVGPVIHCGLLNALSQTLLKLTSPGVPDIYQGNELWDFSLVDPDNRRPVDYALRQAMLAEMAAASGAGAAGLAAGLAASLHDGRAKLYLTWRTLRERAAAPALFESGEYLALAAEGRRAAHVCALARRGGGRTAVAVGGRWYAQLTADQPRDVPGPLPWDDTSLELPAVPGHYRDAFSGRTWPAEGAPRRVLLRDLLEHFPAALLVEEDTA